MNVVSGIVLYILLWWWVLFMTLPLFIKPLKNPEIGHDKGAPENPFILMKLIMTSLISLIIWLICYYVVSLELISFRNY